MQAYLCHQAHAGSAWPCVMIEGEPMALAGLYCLIDMNMSSLPHEIWVHLMS